MFKQKMKKLRNGNGQRGEEMSQRIIFAVQPVFSELGENR